MEKREAAHDQYSKALYAVRINLNDCATKNIQNATIIVPGKAIPIIKLVVNKIISS